MALFHWRRDEMLQGWVCSDGRYITDHSLYQADPFLAKMLKQVLWEFQA